MKKSGNWTVEGLFTERQAAYVLFDVVREYIESLGSISVEATKTQVSFGTKSKFAWVWLPQMWIKKQKDNSITIAFDLDHEVQHTRIRSSVEPRPGRWTHHVVIEKESDFDNNVKMWLREAYVLSLTRISGKRKTS
jgi:hypothetical protein